MMMVIQSLILILYGEVHFTMLKNPMTVDGSI